MDSRWWLESGALADYIPQFTPQYHSHTGLTHTDTLRNKAVHVKINEV